MKLVTSLTLLFFASLSVAEVTCRNVSVPSINSATGASFHRMDQGGAEGAYLYLAVAKSQCTASNNEDISGGVYMVIDNLGDHTADDYELKQYWLSMLVGVKASRSTIDLRGPGGGKNPHNRQVVEPVHIKAN